MDQFPWRSVPEPPFECRTDCKGTIVRSSKPRHVTLGASHSKAHLWRWFLTAFEDEQVALIKTLGHATNQDVLDGKATFWEKTANDRVDNLAKAGAKLHWLTDEQVWQYRALVAVAEEAAVFVAKMQVLSEALSSRDCRRP